jgi:hypothetical protein
MKKRYLIIAGIVLASACQENSNSNDLTSPENSQQPLSVSISQVEAPKSIFLPRNVTRAFSVPTTGQMIPHGGAILSATTTYAIFWGPAWNTNPSFTGDKISGLQSFFQGFGGSSYAGASEEYWKEPAWSSCCSDYAYVTRSSSFGRTFIDNSAVPTANPTVSAVVNKVAGVLAANGVAPRSDGFYAVYSTTPRGSLGFCAWHSYGTVNGVLIKVAWMLNLDGDVSCSPNDGSGLHSAGLTSLANVTAHELSEAITDPAGSGWFAGMADGGENGDKCNFVFNPTTPLVTLSNGARFKIQAEWSNRAFNGGYGVAGFGGERGCLYGQTTNNHLFAKKPIGAQNSQYQYTCSWTASVTGGTPPYTYQWGTTGSNQVPTAGMSGSTFSLQSYSNTQNGFSVVVTVRDAAGAGSSESRSVTNFPANSGLGYADGRYCRQF